MVMRTILMLHLMYGCTVASTHPWILRKINDDKNYLVENMFEGSESTWYVPFFLKVSADTTIQNNIEGLFGEKGQAHDPNFVPGGYIFRLRFPEASLFALSGGWGKKNGEWYCPEIDKEIPIGYCEVWRGDPTEGYSFASFLPGDRPALVSYSRSGEEIERLEFDLSDESGMKNALAKYENKPKPALEMKLLSEYLRGDAGTWRPVAMGRLNFRNQQDSEQEADLLRGIPRLTLTEAIQLLEREDAQLSHPSNVWNRRTGRRL